jgi:hypothetical protein
MKKYILFSPKDIDLNDEPKDSVLWEVKYKVHQTISGLPKEILDALDDSKSTPLPCKKWNEEFVELGLELLYDFPYMKEYGILDENDAALFTATLSALDINKFNNEVLVKIKIANEILSTMNLKETGCMHPEKFHNKMIEYVDLSEEEFILKEDISKYLFDLETLCERCLQYESNIEWKSIS